MLKILGIPLDDTATSYHRVIQPLYYLKQLNWEIEFLTEQNQQEQYKKADIVYVNCLYSESAYQFYRKLVRTGKRLIIDFDDDYFSIPDDSPEKTEIIDRKTGLPYQYNDAKRNYWVKAFLRLADTVVVTTETLKKLYEPFTQKIITIPNCITNDMQRDIPKINNDKLTILWSGSSSHLPDLEILREPLTELIKKHNDKISLCFQGPLDFEKIFPNLPKTIYPGVPFGEYLNLIQSINADIALGPLRSHPFNAAKSNLKYSQMTLMEAAFIGSNFGPYAESINHGETGLVANNSHEWIACVERLLDRTEINKLILNANNYIKENHNIERHIDKWIQILS